MDGPSHSRLESETLLGDLILDRPHLAYRLLLEVPPVALRRSLVNRPVERLSMRGFVKGKQAAMMVNMVWISIIRTVFNVLYVMSVSLLSRLVKRNAMRTTMSGMVLRA